MTALLVEAALLACALIVAGAPLRAPRRCAKPKQIMRL
jgi:hypothetical protein